MGNASLFRKRGGFIGVVHDRSNVNRYLWEEGMGRAPFNNSAPLWGGGGVAPPPPPTLK